MGDVWGAIAAIAALGAAIVALYARSDARKSATASETSAHAAEGSLALQKAEADRARERTDVRWEQVFDAKEPGMVRYRNTGSTPAHNVQVTARVDGELKTVTATLVEPDGFVDVDASAAYAADLELKKWERASAGITDSVFTMSPGVELIARITWESEHGTPGIQVIK